MKHVNKIIVVTITIKVVFLVLFSSGYSIGLFQPFIKSFVTGNLNPWQYYLENGHNTDAFPYHGFMLYLHAVPSYISQLLGAGPTLSNALFKLPSLVADIMIFQMLRKMYPAKELEVTIFYFFNPIIIYSTYLHSQLDIIPTALLFGSVFLINRHSIRLSAAFLGLALATKFHVLIALPLLAFYLLKKYKLKTVLLYFAISLSLLLVIDAPFLLSNGYREMVLLNPRQSIIFDSFVEIGSLKLFMPVLAILTVYFHFFNQRKVNRDFLYSYLGILFIATIFFIYPAPAWYVWIIPYVAIFFIQNQSYRTYPIYISLSVVYLFFFLFFYISEYKSLIFMNQPVNLPHFDLSFSSILFTALEVCLLAIIFSYYRYGLRSNSIYRKQSNMVIGVGGDSGVGKTTLVNNLELILGENLLKLEGDGEHKWERGNQKWDEFTHLDPKANHIHYQSQAIHDLKKNQSVFRRDYNHDTGTFSESALIRPKTYIAISGLHPFYLPKLRKNIDLKIYLDTQEKLRRHWKIIRDTEKRGYSIPKIVKQIESRTSDSTKYIHPQKAFSDLIITYFSTDSFEPGNKNVKINLGLKIICDANIHLDRILENMNCEFKWDYNEDLSTQYVIFKKEPLVNFKEIAESEVVNIEEIIAPNTTFLKGYKGFIQLVTLLMISENLKETDK